MKLNNRGWGIQAMLVGILVLMISLVIISVLVKKTFGDIMDPIYQENHPNDVEKEENDKPNNTYKTYNEIEKAVVEASKKYQKKYYNDILDGEKISVTIRNLQSDKFLPEIKDIKDENINCSGYAIFKNNDNKITYEAYIKCGNNYETLGYQDFYDMY